MDFAHTEVGLLGRDIVTRVCGGGANTALRLRRGGVWVESVMAPRNEDSPKAAFRPRCSKDNSEVGARAAGKVEAAVAAWQSCE